MMEAAVVDSDGMPYFWQPDEDAPFARHIVPMSAQAIRLLYDSAQEEDLGAIVNYVERFYCRKNRDIEVGMFSIFDSDHLSPAHCSLEAVGVWRMTQKMINHVVLTTHMRDCDDGT